jgi:tetratricopeptide (TPR) repeat protein
MAHPDSLKKIILVIFASLLVAAISLLACAQDLPGDSSKDNNSRYNSNILDLSAILGWNQSEVWPDGQNLSNLSENQTSEIDEHIDAPTWNSYGIRAYQRGYANSSIECFNSSINESPDFVDPWNNMGVAHIALHNYSDAIPCFDRALEISESESTILWNNKGVALYHMGQIQEAQDYFNMSLKRDPYYSPAWNNLGVILANQELDKRALEFYRKAISCDMYNNVAWSNIGRSSIKLGRYSDAWDGLHNALILDKSYTPAWVNVAEYYYRIGDMYNCNLSLNIARSQGYNETESNETNRLWPADAEAVMMQDKTTALPSELASRTPAAGWTAAAFSLLFIRKMLFTKR